MAGFDPQCCSKSSSPSPPQTVEREKVVSASFWSLPSFASAQSAGQWVTAHRFLPTGHAWLLLAWAVLLLAAVSLLASEPTSEQLEFFEKKVRPLLSERCYKCHSTQSEKLKGGLLLDSLDGMLKGGEDGLVLTPGNPAKSRLIEAVNYGNPDLQMPPKARLADEQIAALTEWVKSGAPWPKEPPPKALAKSSAFDLERRRREHWAWQPVKVGTTSRRQK